VLIMTSNIGSELITSGGRSVGFGGADDANLDDDLRARMLRRLQEDFRPEFLNRIDEIIIFRQLAAPQLRLITDLLLEETRRRLHAQNITVEVTDPAADWIAEVGYQPEFGARPMRRTIQREVDNRLSRMLLDGALAPGQQVTIDAGDGELRFDVTSGSADRGHAAAAVG